MHRTAFRIVLDNFIVRQTNGRFTNNSETERHFQNIFIDINKSRWQLGVSLSMTRAAALRAAVDKPTLPKKIGKPEPESAAVAEPSPLNRLGSAAAFAAAPCFPTFVFCPFFPFRILLFSVGYGSIGSRGRQRPQNRRLKLL